jgi:hypothetical protein
MDGQHNKDHAKANYRLGMVFVIVLPWHHHGFATTRLF